MFVYFPGHIKKGSSGFFSFLNILEEESLRGESGTEERKRLVGCFVGFSGGCTKGSPEEFTFQTIHPYSRNSDTR
jgi:hypothetical protein